MNLTSPILPTFPELILLSRLVVALVLGAIIGSERQWRHRTAGLKTNALVSLGAASFMVLAPLAFPQSPDSLARLAAQVISGIGFLGAGVILREGLNVRGLNTAATLWCSASAGTLAGSGLIDAAGTVTLLILVINLGLQPLVGLINSAPSRDVMLESSYTIAIRCRAANVAEIKALLIAPMGRGGLWLDGLTIGRLPGNDIAALPVVEILLRCRLARRDDAHIEALLAPLLERGDVQSTSWQIEAMSE